MPISANFEGSRYLLDAYIKGLENPDPLLHELAETLVSDLLERAPEETGRLKGVLTRIRGPFNIAGARGIGVGDATAVVPPEVPAPPGTIKDFIKWYRETYPEGE